MPSFLGQYKELLEKRYCYSRPQSLKKRFGRWSDLGYQKGYVTSCKKGKLKDGYIVWVYPYYFVWGKKGKSPTEQEIASLGGIYRDLITKRPSGFGMKGIGGRVMEQGYNKETYRPGMGTVEKGHWVLVGGNYYIW